MKLTDKDINLIRRMYREKVWDGYTVTIKRLAEWFYCPEITIYKIIMRYTWKHI